MNIIKVASDSQTSSVAGSIAHTIRRHGRAEAQGIGAGAVNQMVKAVILAKRFLAEEGTLITFIPEFAEIEMRGKEFTAVRLTITPVIPADVYLPEADIAADLEERQGRGAEDNELLQKLEEHHAESPILSGGDVDAAWDQAGVGDETVGGTAVTPDQDVVDELGEAVGLTYEDDEPLDTDGKLAERDRDRWELDPASATDQS